MMRLECITLGNFINYDRGGFAYNIPMRVRIVGASGTLYRVVDYFVCVCVF